MYNLNNIKTLAARKKVSMKQLFAYCEISEGGFYKSIDNQSMNIKTLDKIAELLQVSVSELINDRHDTSPEKGLKKSGVVESPVEIYEPPTELAECYKTMYKQQVEITRLQKELEEVKKMSAQGRSANAG